MTDFTSFLTISLMEPPFSFRLPPGDQRWSLSFCSHYHVVKADYDLDERVRCIIIVYFGLYLILYSVSGTTLLLARWFWTFSVSSSFIGPKDFLTISFSVPPFSKRYSYMYVCARVWSIPSAILIIARRPCSSICVSSRRDRVSTTCPVHLCAVCHKHPSEFILSFCRPSGSSAVSVVSESDLQQVEPVEAHAHPAQRRIQSGRL